MRHINREISLRNGTSNKEGSVSESSSPGEFHPQALRTGRESLPSSGSYHPVALLWQPFLISWLLPSLVDQKARSDDPTPSLHPHYRNFNTTTSWSAPMPRIGTLILVVPPLEFLPYHRDDRFPRSTPEPGSGSRRLYAGCRPSSKQVPLGLILEYRKPPVLTSSIHFDTSEVVRLRSPP